MTGQTLLARTNETQGRLGEMARKRFNVMLDLDLIERLNAVKERLGLSVTEQIERGARIWLQSTEWPERRPETARASMKPPIARPH
ncbi:MAG TPA: hypothetical protein VGZ27_00315 [Vicinamibacterales bacterium]|jgi:hypothetical protein|nr:hypothetical protein [Vicinamibacterales bacterium]